MIKWEKLTSTDTLKIEYITKLFQMQLLIQEIFLDTLGRNIDLTQIDTSKGEYTIPYPSFINVIERNLDALVANGYRPSTMRPTRTWLGETKDLPRLNNLDDVNRWFETLQLLEQLIISISQRTPVTGVCIVGSDRTRQVIRTVK